MNDINNTLQCPADLVSVNENKARIIAFFVLLIVIAYLSTGYFYLIGFLIGDFLLRATTTQGTNSLLSLLAGVVVSTFKIKNKLTDRAPKRFAAATGLVFSILILASALFNWSLISLILTIILAFFAALESFVGFCAGCYVYSFLKNTGLVKANDLK